MIVDASAIVAIMVREPDADALTKRLRAARVRLTHPISIYESATAVSRVNAIPIKDVGRDVDEYLATFHMQVVSIDAATAASALDAFARYGKGRHPAALNMGDCFSYAVAKLRGMPLLYKGDDFALTDLA